MELISMPLNIPEVDLGDIHFRDHWQFEVKSEFIPDNALKMHEYTQEFFIFVPGALQVNEGSYDRELFYRDQTNLVRYKTPVFTFTELLDSENTLSPFVRLDSMVSLKRDATNKKEVENEIKLLGNIFRSTLRSWVEDASISTIKSEELNQLIADIHSFRQRYAVLWERFENTWKESEISIPFRYVDEFISNCINTYLVFLLEKIEERPKETEAIDVTKLKELLIKEKKYREEKNQEPLPGEHHAIHNEYVIYRRGLLNKYVVGALLLNTNRYSLKNTMRNIIGSISAGIAMFIFLILFGWGGQVLVINSTAFLVATVFLYILKDRMKESIRRLSYKSAFKWFPDFTTKILSPEPLKHIGELRESFSMLTPSELPEDVYDQRNTGFHTVLESFKRPENVLYHKKSLHITNLLRQQYERRRGFNVIFRFDIHHLVNKASNPYIMYTTLDPLTGKIQKKRLSKVYHLNIIMRNSYTLPDKTHKVELRKYRIIVDKNGIKRVEGVD
jgi:hypothetical protein